MDWLVIVVRLTGEASRTRVGVWRELRRIGAAPVAAGVWTVPDTPFFSEAVPRVVELAGRGAGSVLVLPTPGSEDAGSEGLRSAFRELRLDEWREFTGDCGAFEAEIAKEIRNGKFTLAELEEEEQSLDRLRRWYRDLKSRDVLELSEAQAAEKRLRECTTVFDEYAEKVYATLHAPAAHALPEAEG